MLTKKEIIKNGYLNASQFDLLVMKCKNYIKAYYSTLDIWNGCTESDKQYFNSVKLDLYEFLPWNVKVNFNNNYPDKINFIVFDLLDKSDELKEFRIDALSGQVIE